MDHFKTKAAAGVFLLRDRKGKTEILLQLRSKNVSGAGKWDRPAAGHLEEGESLLACAKREALEEIGVEFNESDILFKTVIHNRGEVAVGPYINLSLFIKKYKGRPHVCEPEKCDALKWFDIENLPTNLWPLPTPEAIKNFKERISYSEIGWKN